MIEILQLSFLSTVPPDFSVRDRESNRNYRISLC
jgi:hypothetical protein